MAWFCLRGLNFVFIIIRFQLPEVHEHQAPSHLFFASDEILGG